MIKEAKLIFFRVVLIVAVLLLINGGIFFFEYRSVNKSLTGLSIKDTVSEAYSNTPQISKIFLLIQWTLLLFLLIFTYIKDKGIKVVKNEISGINLNKMSKKQGTDLDTLYNILKNKKQLRISNIARIFKVSKDVAMEWCKILESGNLVIIDYPSAREPIIKIIEK